MAGNMPDVQKLSPDERERHVDILNGIFGGVLAPESWTLSQSYYYGQVGTNPSHRVELVEGEYLDLVPGLDRTAISKPARNGSACERPVRAEGAYAPVSEKRFEVYRQKVLDNLHREASGSGKHFALLRNAKALGGVAAEAGFADKDLVQALLDVLPDSVKDWKLAARTAADGLARGRQEPIGLSNRPEFSRQPDPPPPSEAASPGDDPPPAGPDSESQSDPPPEEAASWWDAPGPVEEGEAEIEWLPQGYTRDDQAMWFQESPKKSRKGDADEEPKRIWICRPFHILAEIATRTAATGACYWDGGIAVGSSTSCRSSGASCMPHETRSPRS